MKQSHTRKAWLWLNGLSVSKLLSKADTKLKWHFHPPLGQSAITNIQNMHIIIAATFRFQSHLLAFTSQQRYIWFHVCPQNMYPLQFRPSTYHPSRHKPIFKQQQCTWKRRSRETKQKTKSCLLERYSSNSTGCKCSSWFQILSAALLQCERGNLPPNLCTISFNPCDPSWSPYNWIVPTTAESK